MTRFLFFLLFIFSISIHSQVTLRILKVPENTSVNDTIFFAGSINSWNPSSLNYILKPDSKGFYSITLPENNGTIAFKFTRGSWNSVEGDSLGNQIANRTFTFSGQPQTIDLTIQSWQNTPNEDRKSTASSNVQILSNDFEIPQLNKQRRIWIYLPPDYFTTNKTYPVLYMQDGQNLFDDATSYSGEWHIDETLNDLHAQGDYGAIVVGIDNGGTDRINEYSPWKNQEYGGGEGDLYMYFIAQTLKPYIDKNYRTNPKASKNALIGSSLGALISTYGAVKYSNTFGKVGNLSPAYWFNAKDLNTYILSQPKKLKKLKMYFVAGQNESTEMVSDISTIRENLIKKRMKSSCTFVKIDPNGVHNETYWSKEFAALYLWLFPQK